MCVVLAGGLTTDLILWLMLIAKNRTAGDFIGRPGPAGDADGRRPPRLRNYGLAGTANAPEPNRHAGRCDLLKAVR